VAYLVIRIRRERHPRRADIARARRLFERFHSFAPPVLLRHRCPRQMSGVLVKVGRLRGLIYTSDKGCPGRPLTYIHFMETMPLLACDPDGRQLHILGGRYRVTARGIEG
jgi:hypothetical protein